MLCVVPRADVAREIEQTEQAAAALAAETPRCFGAASLDPRAKDCPNPELEDVLVPTPAAAKEDYPKYADCCNEPLRRPVRAVPVRRARARASRTSR